MHYMWHHIHSLGHHTTLCMTSGPHHLTSLPLYLCHHTHPRDAIRATISMTSHPVYLWHHTLYVYDISTLYGITHSVMTTQPLCNFTVTLPDITATVSVSSHPVDQFYQAQCMYDIIATMCMTSYALHVTSHPQFRTSHHFMYDIRSTLSDLTSTVSLSSHPP